ncbi:MAG: hypothetical protein E5Y34_13805 [Mesorhizobium sp.]|nr:MAG: hypothetical protein E5Y34_13805 [Mesorhizobium sp.]
MRRLNRSWALKATALCCRSLLSKHHHKRTRRPKHRLTAPQAPCSAVPSPDRDGTLDWIGGGSRAAAVSGIAEEAKALFVRKPIVETLPECHRRFTELCSHRGDLQRGRVRHFRPLPTAKNRRRLISLYPHARRDTRQRDSSNIAAVEKTSHMQQF